LIRFRSISPELVPLGDYNQRLGAFRDLIGAIAVLDIGEYLPGLLHRPGIEGFDPRAFFQEPGDDLHGGRVPHVVGIGFEGQPQDPDDLIFKNPESLLDLVEEVIDLGFY